jgi:hypothetical protein
MDIQPLTIETIFNLIRERAAKIKTPVIVDARIAISLDEAQLLDLKPSRTMEIIHF